jgi:hypothetical protein
MVLLNVYISLEQSGKKRILYGKVSVTWKKY